MTDTSNQTSEFQTASKVGRTSLIVEFWDFLKCNKKWWLTPIILVMLLVGLFVMFGSTAAAPFIYTLF